MIKTPLSIALGGAFWTPGATVIGGSTPTFDQQILKLFANGEQGFFYDPNDLSTMFQDAVGTVPVTAAGQPVGLMKDKSGRNNHAFQTVSASRPILQSNATTGAYYLEFDGADDFLQTNSIDFTATDKVSLFAGVRKLSDADTGMLMELSTSSDSFPRSFYLAAPQAGNASFRFSAKGNTHASSVADVPLGVATAPFSCVAVVKSAMVSGGDVSIKLNQNTYTVKNTYAIGNYRNDPLYIGRRGGTSLPFTGHIYGLIGVGKLASDDETVAIEKELAKRVGVTLDV